jgi:alcohol dehydrogenase class IV
MYQIYCRAFQKMMKFASVFLPWRKPELIKGEGCLKKLPELLVDCNITRVLIVTDQGIRSTGLLNDLLLRLSEKKVHYIVFDRTVPNPTIDNIEEALDIYYQHNCKGMIGFGGGSSMDCAKGVAARVARPDKSISQLRGLLKVRRRTPMLIAVPTTAGTGSEATLAAVIVDSETNEKYPINDFQLIPNYAVLDPLLTKNLPASITASTGMDALTHAVEAYIGKSNTEETRKYCKQAVKLIFHNLHQAYQDGSNMRARKNMQIASYYAGIAFTRAYVGNIHAIAHTLGGFYSTPHGLANAVIMPYVLEYYGEKVYKPLAELSDTIGLCNKSDTDKQKAECFIRELRKMNKAMGIPDKISGIKESDIPIMAQRAMKEANPLYPVPMIFSLADFKCIYYFIKG